MKKILSELKARAPHIAHRAAQPLRVHIKPPRFPGGEYIVRLINSLSPLGKRIFGISAALFFICTLAAGIALNEHFKVVIPAPGGQLVEGTVGTPRFINPLLAISDAERDLTALVYSGLMRAAPSGTLIPDLAEEYTVSSDGLTYTFTLKDDIAWHDGKPVTSADVIFTIEKVQDPALKSPKRASWEGVTAEAIDNRTIRFMLEKPYSPFLENTTLGILPKHVWEHLDANEFSFARPNTRPIGTGPYRIAEIKTDNEGIPQYYDLKPFEGFSLGEPYIQKIRLRFYPDEEALTAALEAGAIKAASAIAPQHARTLREEGLRVFSYKLPRTFGVFFNQNKNAVFTEKEVRRALNIALDRDRIVEELLAGYGTPLYGPLPPGALGYEVQNNVKSGFSATSTEAHLERARDILAEAGWKADEESGIRIKGNQALAFSLVTPRIEELQEAARMIQGAWENIGANVQLKVFQTSDLNRSVIRPREYDALFFGEVIGRESDPFAFWHSSQRNDPGLNIALYANITTDNLLEDGRTTFNREERIQIYKSLNEEVASDIPAVFVYAPDFIYILNTNIRGVTPGIITLPAERFLDVHDWYVNTDRVWRIFAD